jgi:hypothetical protein
MLDSKLSVFADGRHRAGGILRVGRSDIERLCDVADCSCIVNHPPANLPARCPATCNSENRAALARCIRVFEIDCEQLPNHYWAKEEVL